ncbi:MAG: hypothetical protein HGJ99_16965 [Thiobacillus sp.]|nr:hypothetical protein [Thiobacillus sp.]MBC2741189.1 hypothetical protein [Thiobacillus sp.]MBC2761449.1 hypothetical protein [Thiobacillus sp.]
MERLDGMHNDSASILADPTQCLEAHGDYLFRYAMKHLRDHALAEDVVQEALLAALEARVPFSGDASQRTWADGHTQAQDCRRDTQARTRNALRKRGRGRPRRPR